MPRIVAISDTHTMGVGKQELPPGDILIHAGDLTFRGTEKECKAGMKWLQSLTYRYKHVIFVPGNHDFYFDTRFKHGHHFRTWRITRYWSLRGFLEHYCPDVHVLIDRAVEIEGLKFYGSPWQPWFWDWAFNFPANVEMMHHHAAIQHNREAAARKWAEIPEDTQVLITHSPPYGILDAIGNKMDAEDDRTGCPELRKRIHELRHLRLHVFGHIHEGYGRLDYETLYLDVNNVQEPGTLTFVNAAINTREYKPVNPPIVVQI